MVTKYIYRLTFVFIIIGMYLMIGCSTETVGEDYYCVNCESQEPDTAQLIVKISYPKTSHSIRVLIFKNEFSLDKKMDTILNVIADTGVIKMYVDMNQYYSAEAIYSVYGKEIRAIDGGWFETKKIDGCQNTCWKLVGGDYDLRLK